jgi:cobalamin synthase
MSTPPEAPFAQPIQHAPPGADLPHSLRWLPLAGLGLSLAQGALFVLGTLLWPQAVAVLLAICFGIWLSSARHEVGWMRWAARSPGPTDPIGLVGALAGGLMLLLKIEILRHIESDWLVACLICAAAASRALAVLALAPGTQAQAARVAALGAAPLIALTLWTFNAWPALFGLTSAIVAVALARRSIRRGSRPAGESGLGALQQVAEVSMLLGMLIVLADTGMPPLESTEDIE